jgi:hypothetical protein
MTSTFLYRCPNTGQTVQGWSTDEVKDNDDDTYQSLACVACTRVHLVNLRRLDQPGARLASSVGRRLNRCHDHA